MDIAGIRLRGVCKTFHFDCTGVALQRGDYVVVQTERGASLGAVIRRIDDHPPKGEKPPFGVWSSIRRTTWPSDAPRSVCTTA